MAIFQKNKKYYIDYYDSHGRRHREAVGTNKRQAEFALAARQRDITLNKFNLNNKTRDISFNDFADKYLEYAHTHKRSYGRDVTILKWLKAEFGDLHIAKIVPWQVEKYKSQRRRCVKAATVNREVALLKRMLNLAVEWGDLQENPIRSVKLYREDRRGERVLTEEEEARLLKECSPHLKPIVLTAIYTGMRLGEILSLTWENVHLNEGYITVTAENSKSRRARNIPLNSIVREVLYGQSRNSEVVFPSPKTGKAWYSSTNPLKTGFWAACRRAKIEGLRFHDLRATFATRLIAANVNIVDVGKLLGHADIKTTMRYAYSNVDNQKKAVEALCAERQALNGHQKEEENLTVKDKVLYLASSA